jgi:hypothetical protein
MKLKLKKIDLKERHKKDLSQLSLTCQTHDSIHKTRITHEIGITS